jgi:hypothetical protein
MEVGPTYLASKFEDHCLPTTPTTKHQDVTTCYTGLGHIPWNDLSNSNWNVRSPYWLGSFSIETSYRLDNRGVGVESR